MNTADLQNYLPTALLLIGAIGTSAAIRQYGDRLVSIIASMTPQGEASHRIVIESDPSRTYHSPMTLEG